MLFLIISMLLKTLNQEISGKKEEIVCQRLLVRRTLGKFSANHLRTEIYLTDSKNTVINYLNASKILKYEK